MNISASRSQDNWPDYKCSTNVPHGAFDGIIKAEGNAHQLEGTPCADVAVGVLVCRCRCA